MMTIDQPLAEVLLKLLRHFNGDEALPDHVDDVSQEDLAEDVITTQTLYGKVHFDDRKTSLAVAEAARDIHYALIDLNAEKPINDTGYNQARDLIVNELAKLVGKLRDGE
jgi:hypothetical protein